MDCKSCQNQFSSYVEGLLSDEEKAKFNVHLKGCPNCQAGLVSFKKMLESLRTMEKPQTPNLLAGIHEKLFLRQPWWAALKERFLSPWPQSLPLHGLALATVAILIFFIVGIPREFRGRYLGEKRLHLAYNAKEPAGKAWQLADGDKIAPDDSNLLRKQEVDLKQTRSDKEILSLAEPTREVEAPLVSVRAAGLFGEVSREKAEGKAMQVASLDTYTDRVGEAPAKDESHAPLQVTWRVTDIEAAIAQINEWVSDRNGTVSSIADRQLTIQLAASDLPSFLEQFSSKPLPKEDGLIPTVPESGPIVFQGEAASSPVPSRGFRAVASMSREEALPQEGLVVILLELVPSE